MEGKNKLVFAGDGCQIEIVAFKCMSVCQVWAVDTGGKVLSDFTVNILFACYDVNEQTKLFLIPACKYTRLM